MATRSTRGVTRSKGPVKGGKRIEDSKSGGAGRSGTAGRPAAGEKGAALDRAIQRDAERVAAKRKAAKPAAGKSGGGKSAVKPPGREEYPANPLPAQHQAKPGAEAAMRPRPHYRAPDYRGSGKLEGLVALITGADSGIGRAVAVLYAREGASVAIAYLSEHGDAEETRRAVEAEGQRALLLPGDVTDPRFCRETVEHTVREFGRLDILVNNAAFQQHTGRLEDISDEQWDRTFRTNIYGYFYMCRAALPHLKNGAAIINTGSITGIEGSKDLLDYSSTKGAIHSFTKSLARNLVERGIRVNAVAPGPVWTPLNPADAPAEKVREFGADTPMGRPAQPEELGPAFVFLAAASDSSYITGNVLPVLGGQTI
ncbi:MAG: SDR family oxidoreductase [Gemmatimonadaceae bacterium]